jgi:2-oxoglutarate ferredoxin oxidoreductase subunit alpha
MTVDCQDKVVKRLIAKINDHADAIVRLEEDANDDAEVVVVSYGITARIARMAVQRARDEGIRAGSLRLITIWPFAEKRIRELARTAKAFVVPEINRGQMVLEVERCVAGRANVISVPHSGGSVHDPAVIVDAIRRSVR